MSSLESLNLDAVQHGAPLHPDLRIEPGKTSGIKDSFEPSEVYSAIAVAARTLRKKPSANLLPDWEPIPSEVADKHSDPASKMLIEMANASLDPVESHEEQRTFNSESVKAIGSCMLVESGLAKAFAQMQDPENLLPGHDKKVGYELIADDAGKVLAVGKGYGQPGAMALETLVINGIPYPPGTWLRADTAENRERSGPAQMTPGEEINYSEQRIVPAGDIVDIAAQRLTGYGLDPADRAIDFKRPLDLTKPPEEVAEGYVHDTATEAIAHQATMDDLRAIAQNAYTRHSSQ